MKRILIFSVAYEPFIGGSEIAVREITNRITDIEFDMITLNLDGMQMAHEKVGNISVHRIGRPGRISKLLYPFAAARLGLKLDAQKKYDAIWSIMASFSGFAALFFKYRRLSMPFILTLQEGDPIGYIKRQVWFVYPLFKQIFKKADRIQTISHYLANWAKDMGAKAALVVIPNGVDIANFTKIPSEESKQALCKRLGKNSSDVFLITTSRLVIKNGISDVISALKLLPPNIKFLIAGAGDLEAKHKKQVQDSGLSDRVIFLGEVKYREIPKYLAVSDIFIRPALSEGMGNSFIEAMAAGVPVIATPVGGIPDFLKDKETGVLCEVQNPKSIAEAVRLLLNDHVLQEKIVANAKALVVEKYDWNLVAERMRQEILL